MKGYTKYVRNVLVNYCAHKYQDQIDYALAVSEERAKDIEKLTRGQADNKRWLLERQWMITASRFGGISRITLKRQIRKLCESIACPKVLNSPAVHHGKLYEEKAIKQFEEKFHIWTLKCGLFVPVDRLNLEVSPDAIVGDDGIVEVKCPYAGRNIPILPGPKFRHLQLDSNNQVCLKKTKLVL